ncbi:2-oxo-4-hydroxy-4-carboxy-5-ureidoimidazoline decarboxylase [Streptomyces sp. CB02613]|uniref:2-oxo-4-hydroxy-4-carboxy-5-ureidoimidazoline decarboxylase n=1 Tax=Streptomyces sp. CB02613 TaxID=2020328 RepID=UPI00081B0A90|nr:MULTISPECIES: 2-oxo-4-hydroxy-4-carboxy-5-ureidoimidazoline decarboxylase [unclassified Streptomyces]PJN28347.1 2-oxo-4-hydroxy-4-carboxy-5-ureidoimidazoline decarboxylase [Streptomyces sp. CB02613]SCD32877.1 2-oxo-4-hydroxy-4-carboxy-5-ureidoimidazoline decarboxylase [Streptomyces sp. Termitarium-T10T-6]
MPVQPRHPAPADAPVPADAPASADAPAPPADGAPVDHAVGLAHFNSLPFAAAEAAFLECCGSLRWAHRMAAHRPYPDLGALLAASDEAGYDLAPSDIAEALAAEPAPCLHHDAPRAAHLALRAAHAAYESRFGHTFVICLDAYGSSQHVDQVLAGIRVRMEHEVDEERAVTAEELRRLARSRIVELMTAGPGLED